jgi:DNA modification methylase
MVVVSQSAAACGGQAVIILSPMTPERKTRTSSFGSKGRISHDASLFYASRMYDDHPGEDDSSPYVENPVPVGVLDQILVASSEQMDQLPDSCIHLMVTSPPYNARKEYDEDLTLGEYLTLLEKVFSETYRVLVPGGRACVNIANLGRKPYIPLNALIAQMMIEIGFLMRGEIIWDKGSSVGSSTAWGSWMSASNPTLRDVHEYILVFSKGRFKREAGGRAPTIERDEFLEYTRSVWQFPTESASRVGHPAPFPVELPRRLSQLYTFDEEIVLDPFMGSGTSAIAALESGRHYVGYELDEDYAKLARDRIAEHL